MTESANDRGPKLKGLDPELRQMVIDTVRQLRTRLLTREKILEYDKNEFFPEKTIREILGPDIGLQLLFIPEVYFPLLIWCSSPDTLSNFFVFNQDKYSLI